MRTAQEGTGYQNECRALAVLTFVSMIGPGWLGISLPHARGYGDRVAVAVYSEHKMKAVTRSLPEYMAHDFCGRDTDQEQAVIQHRFPSPLAMGDLASKPLHCLFGPKQLL